MRIAESVFENTTTKMSKRFLNWLILTIHTVALIPGKVNFTRLSRYGGHPAKTFASNFKTPVDWMKVNIGMALDCFGPSDDIAVASLGASPESLELDLNTFGFIFECLCFRDLRVYSQALGGRLSYYHDRFGLEADAVLHLDDGRYALIECKLGSREIEEGAKHLLEIKRLVSEKNKAEKQMKLREPDLLIVLTGGEMAYTREDGVKIIPIGCLRD